MRNKGKKDRGRLKNWLIWVGETPNACGTNLCANSFSKINGVFEPLLAPRGWRVHRVGAQVGINRCWRASGWSLAWPDGLRTLLLGHGVLKHTLINWDERRRKKEKVNTQPGSGWDGNMLQSCRSIKHSWDAHCDNWMCKLTWGRKLKGIPHQKKSRVLIFTNLDLNVATAYPHRLPWNKLLTFNLFIPFSIPRGSEHLIVKG